MIKAKAIPINTLHTAFSMNCIQLKLLTDDRFVICNIVMQCKREQSRCQMGRRATEVQGLKSNEGDGNQSPNWKDALLCWVRWERGGGATSRKQHHLDSHTLLIPPRTEDQLHQPRGEITSKADRHNPATTCAWGQEVVPVRVKHFAFTR